MDICFASNNKNKLNEIRLLLEPDFFVMSLDQIGCFEELPETQSTIEGNSLQKAQFVYEHYHVPCFADDSGLEVDALGGAPGVNSAYYAGPQKNDQDNVDLLLNNLRGHKSREAHFKAVITLVGFGEPKVFTGVIRGTIIDERRGSGGFGYDPVFVADGFSKTFAEMTIEEKNKISHRFLATQQLVQFLKAGSTPV